MSQKAGKGISYTISALCGLLDISRQGYYKHKETNAEQDVLISSITYYCQSLRQELPRSGCRELYSLCKSRFGEKFTIGRDQFIDVLRANGMMLRRRRYRPRTTNSDHPYRIYPDLLNTSPKYVACGVCRMMVGDITYISTKEGFAYLSLLTDVFSRIIVGYALFRTLEAEGPVKALMMACDFYKGQGFNLSGLIHHSDRGVQYASKGYVSLLKERGIAISMTQTGDPLHNALAERMNNTVKNGWLFDYENKTFDEAQEGVARSIYLYNWARPHQALAMKTPMQMLPGEHPNPLCSADALKHQLNKTNYKEQTILVCQ